MLRNFDLKAVAWSSPQTLVRAGLGVLFAANLVAAGFAFHWWGDSPADLERKLNDARHDLANARDRLSNSKTLAAKIATARTQGGSFMGEYMTPRRTTYSTILGELNQMAQQSGIKYREGSVVRDAIEGSQSLSMLTISTGYEATYPNLLKFMNLIDKSKRFMIIESLQAQPQQQSGILLVTIKLYTFVRDDLGDQA